MNVAVTGKLWLLVVNGVSFHMQSVAAYLTMSFVSPVTFRYGHNTDNEFQWNLVTARTIDKLTKYYVLVSIP